jgi:hypothetical protein
MADNRFGSKETTRQKWSKKMQTQMSRSNAELKGKVIVQVAPKNPRRPGSQGHQSFMIIEKAGGKIAYDDYRVKGGRTQDLRWDLQHDYVKLAKRPGRRPVLTIAK